MFDKDLSKDSSCSLVNPWFIGNNLPSSMRVKSESYSLFVQKLSIKYSDNTTIP